LVLAYNDGANQKGSIILANSNAFVISRCTFEVKEGVNLVLSDSQGNISS